MSYTCRVGRFPTTQSWGSLSLCVVQFQMRLNYYVLFTTNTQRENMQFIFAYVVFPLLIQLNSLSSHCYVIIHIFPVVSFLLLLMLLSISSSVVCYFLLCPQIFHLLSVFNSFFLSFVLFCSFYFKQIGFHSNSQMFN